MTVLGVAALLGGIAYAMVFHPYWIIRVFYDLPKEHHGGSLEEVVLEELNGFWSAADGEKAVLCRFEGRAVYCVMQQERLRTFRGSVSDWRLGGATLSLVDTETGSRADVRVTFVDMQFKTLAGTTASGESWPFADEYVPLMRSDGVVGCPAEFRAAIESMRCSGRPVSDHVK